MRVWKDILWPGRWHLIDGRIFECRPEHIGQYAERLKGMIRYGLKVPLCWEHRRRAVPLSTHALVNDPDSHCFAEIEDVRIGPGNVLEAAAEVRDPGDLAQLMRTKWCSPYIEPRTFTDDIGRRWPGWSILHVAATPVPINRNQRTFWTESPAPVRMSRRGVVVGMGIEVTSVAPILMSGARVEKAMSDRTNKLPETIEALEDLGLHLGNGTNAANFLERLGAACRTKKALRSRSAGIGMSAAFGGSSALRRQLAEEAEAKKQGRRLAELYLGKA